MKFEQDVRNKIAGLLEDLLGDPSAETFEVVLSRLTRMAIVGTAPPGSRRNQPVSPQPRRTDESDRFEENFSSDKEAFIAP
jgi:hypothetical protein